MTMTKPFPETSRERIDNLIVEAQEIMAEIANTPYDGSIRTLMDGYHIIKHWEPVMKHLERFRNYVNPTKNN
jgi:hypothetical protein